MDRYCVHGSHELRVWGGKEGSGNIFRGFMEMSASNHRMIWMGSISHVLLAAAKKCKKSAPKRA